MSMAGLHKYFKPALPSKESTGISEVATKEANAAVEKVLEEGGQPRKRKYQHVIVSALTRKSPSMTSIRQGSMKNYLLTVMMRTLFRIWTELKCIYLVLGFVC